MMFRRFFCLVVVALLLSSSAFAAQLIWYQGDVRPDAPNSCGSGISWGRHAGVDEGSLANDADAIDGWAWHIIDTGTAKDHWRTGPSDNIAGAVGATIVARVKVMSEISGGGNIGFLEHGGLTAEYHWGGPTGHVKETQRSEGGYGEAYVTGDNKYHILRITTIGTDQSSRVIRLYFDENPVPVVEITNAISIGGTGVDAFAFGTTSTAGSQDIYFDWITGSNLGAFAPGAEVAVIGKSLVMGAVPEPSSMMALAAGLATIAGTAFRRRK